MWGISPSRARLYGRIAIKKPFLIKKHRQSRLRWCKERAGWNAINWGRVIFSDESKIELFPQRRIYVRRNPGKALSPSMINSTRKFSPSIMIWGAIRNDRRKILYRCPSSVNQLTYKTILNETLPEIYTTRHLFQHDGAKCHTAESVRVFGGKTSQSTSELSSSEPRPLDHRTSLGLAKRESS